MLPPKATGGRRPNSGAALEHGGDVWLHRHLADKGGTQRSARAHPPRQVLANHHAGEVQVCAAIRRHDRCVRHAKAAHPPHLEIGVDHAARLLVGGHAASAGGVLDVARFAQHDCIQRVILQSSGVGHREARLTELDGISEARERRQCGQAGQASHAIAKAKPVPRVRQHVFLDNRLRLRVGGSEAQLPARERVVESDAHSTARRGAFTTGQAAVVVGDHDHVALAATSKTTAVGQATIGVPRIRPLRAEFRLQGHAGAQDRMVHQVLADSRQVLPHGDAERLERAGGADARAHQDGGAVDRAGAKHDFLRGDILPRVAEAHAHTGGAAALEEDAVHQRAATDGEIGPASRGLQVAVIGGDAQPTAQIDRVAGNALALWRVQVGLPAVACRQRGIAQAKIDGAPMPHRH